jgi:hypothetical protein
MSQIGENASFRVPTVWKNLEKFWNSEEKNSRALKRFGIL